MPMTWEEKIAYHKNRSNQIAQSIIEQIEEGIDKWEMPWHKGLPQAFNRVTGKYYGGNNLLILWEECLKKDYSQNVWATMRQWNRINSGVKAGSKGTLVKFVIPQNEIEEYDQLELELADDQADDVDGFRIFFHYVFNVDQVTNNRQNQIGIFDTQKSGFALIDEFVEKAEVDVEHKGNRAFYSVKNDLVTMPHKASFKSVNDATPLENYYATLLHEIIHWTGHPSRCDRSLINKFGTPRYAFEELIAELGTAILTTQFQNRNVPRLTHAKYVRNWLTILKNDFNYFLQALKLSRTAIHWLFEKTEILPFELKDHYNRLVDEKFAESLDDYVKEIKADTALQKVIDSWDELDEAARERIMIFIRNEFSEKN